MNRSATPTRRRLLQIAAGAALATAATRPFAQAEAKTLRIGFQKFNTLNILKGTGQLERALAPLGWKVQWYEFATGPVLLEALNAGSIDFGHAADTPTVFAQAAGADVVYLAAEQPYPRGIGILVAKDSPLRTIGDLKGKKIAIGRGWNVQYLLVRALEAQGLGVDDVQSQWVTSASDARLAFESGRVDAVGLWDPFLAGAQLASEARVLRDGEGLSNNRTFHVSTPRFAAANAALLRAVFAELRKTNDWSDKNPQAVADLLAPQLGVPPAVLRLASERRHYTAVALDDAIVAEQQRIADTFLRLKLVLRSIQVRDAVWRENLV